MSETPKLEKLTLKKLINNPLLSSKVFTLMEQQKSYDYILRFLESKGYKMAKGSLTNLKKKVQESKEQGIPLTSMVDHRKKTSIDDVPDHKITGYTGKEDKPVVTDQAISATPIYSEEQVLESIISKGYKTLQESDYIDSNVLMKALDLHARYFGAKNRGLTGEALKQYQLINEAQQQAMKEVFFRYIPADKQKEALKEMDKRSKEILSQIGATKQGRELLKALQNANLSVD